MAHAAALKGVPYFEGLDAAQRLDQARQGLDEYFGHVRATAFTPIACGAGCSGCCIFPTRISALPLEVRRIVDLVEQQGRLEEVAERAEKRKSRRRGACPLLGCDGRCTVCPERPLACRGYQSIDLDACNAAVAEPKSLVPGIPQLMAATHAAPALARWDPAEIVDLFEELPAITAARLKQAQKRQRRAARAGP
jgi:Fe-S-cluster containining protein